MSTVVLRTLACALDVRVPDRLEPDALDIASAIASKVSLHYCACLRLRLSVVLSSIMCCCAISSERVVRPQDRMAARAL